MNDLKIRLEQLRELLRIEFLRNSRIETPWSCVEGDCPHLGKPIPKSCKCYEEMQRQHVAAVRKELGL